MIKRSYISGKLQICITALFFLIVFSLNINADSSVTGDTTINKCETKEYTISVQNTSGSSISSIVVNNSLVNLTDFSFVPGSVSIDVNGGAAFSTADPSVSGSVLTWDMDSITGSGFSLNNGDTLNVTFSLNAGCSAVSGSQNVSIAYEVAGTPATDTSNFSIEVLPGAVTVKIDPNVVSKSLGEDALWTITVENTGLGRISNVVVTDVLGAGLTYVSSSDSGQNTGQTTTWGPGQVAGLSFMDPGDIVSFSITATVTACDNLEHTADARWGCDMVTDCFNTDTDGGTATASVQRVVKTPRIEYLAPDVDFNYCENVKIVTFDISNAGDGTAYDVWTVVDFGDLTVSNVSSGAVYNNTDKRFELADPLLPGASYTLTFELNFSQWCSGNFPQGDLLWQKVYKDACSNEFYPPVELSQINEPAQRSSLNVSKTGAPAEIEIGESVTYTITSSYSGSVNCGSGSAGTVTVVDTLPDGFTVTDAGGGVWDDGGSGSGGTVTWTYTPPATLSTNLTVKSPGPEDCATACNTVFTNRITATGTDCCGCTLTATDEQSTAIECQELVTSEKTSTSPALRCGIITYTNTYRFDDNPILDSLYVYELSFNERAENGQTYVNNSVQITLDGNPITGYRITNNTGSGGTFYIDDLLSNQSVRNSELVISYQLRIPQSPSSCENLSFYSWSDLDLGFTTGSACLGDGIIHETTEVTVVPPAMSINISGLNQIVHKCETQTVTLTITQTSDSPADPKDVKVVLSGLNYYVVDPSATVTGGSVAPVSAVPAQAGNDYVWTFNDAFTANGAEATIQINVQKRCSGTGDLVATVYYDDLCTDDSTPDETCSASDTASPALLLGGDLLVEKNPEVYYAKENYAEWKIYVTNRGTGTAYNVWVDDILGAGMTYVSAVVDDMAGVTVNTNTDHNGSGINGASVMIDKIEAGHRREITFRADLDACDNLVNTVNSSWGCNSVACQSTVTDVSEVKLPAPNLVNTNVVTPSGITACSTPAGFITLKNSGQVNCYNLQATETLPAGLTYVSGSTRWRVDGGTWNGPNVSYDPASVTSPLVWTRTQIPALAELEPGSNIEIEFNMDAECTFTGGTITVSTQYENPCASVFNTADSNFSLNFNEPDIRVEKIRTSAPIGCNELVEWTVRVTNNSGYTVPVIWVEDTLGDAYTFDSSAGDGTYSGDNGTNAGQKVSWELKDVPSGTSVDLIIRATSDSGPCNSDINNTAEAWWGCGVADGSSATKPGVDAPDDSLCLNSTGVQIVKSETREPSMAYVNIGMTPSTIDSCNDSTELTVVIENTGPTDASSVDLVISLPPGLTYNAGTAHIGIGTDNTVTATSVSDPAVSGSVLTFYDTGDKGNNLADTIEADGGNDTVVLKFSVQSSCYTTSNIDFNLRYYDCCDDTQYSATDSSQLTALYPQLSVTKTPVNSQVECGTQQTWTITVTNNGTGNAQVVRVEDTPGDWIDIRTGQPGDPADMGGGVYGWEINNLAAGGGSQTFTVVGTLNPDGLPNQNDCTVSLRQNNVEAIWACGTSGDAVDSNPATTTDYNCENNTPATAPAATLLMPNLIVSSITPVVSCSADGVFSGTVSVTVTNNGSGSTGGQFTVEVTDGQGWTGTGTYSNAIPAGASADVTIDAVTWTPSCQPCSAPYTFNATADLNNDICECNETDNSTITATEYSVPSPDIEVSADSLNISCSSDGVAVITGSVTLINNGCNSDITTSIPMRFTLYDNTGCTGNVISTWTETFTSANISAGGGTQAFMISGHQVTSDLVNNSTGCQMSIFVEADYNNSVCECDGTDNTYCADNKNIDIPDLEATGDTLEIDCFADGQVSVSGNITLRNNGCGSNMTSDVPVRFVMYDRPGCSGNVIATWTDTLGSANIASGGGSQVFAITPENITTDLVSNSTGCQVSIQAEIDYNNSICESDGTNNIYCADNKSVDIPDLEVTGDTLSINCSADGQVLVAGSVTLTNNGCGSNMISDVPVRFTIYDNTDCSGNQVTQWTETLSGLNIAAGGGTQSVSISDYTIIEDFATNSTSCNLSVRIEVDYASAICESDSSNNSFCSNKSVSIPVLEVNSVTPSVTCTNDGSLAGTVTVNVVNTGCGDASGAVVRLTSDCGYTFTEQSVDLTAGSDQNLTFNYTPSGAQCTCTFTAVIDPDNNICEGNTDGHTLSSGIYTMNVPDLETASQNLVIQCVDDGEFEVSGTVTIANTGCGSALTTDLPVQFTLYDQGGCAGNITEQWRETFTGSAINSGGGTQTFTITPRRIRTDYFQASDNCTTSIRIDTDPDDVICEYDGTNNSLCADMTSDCLDIAVSAVSGAINCTSDGNISGLITVNITNSGGKPITQDFNVRVSDDHGWSAERSFTSLGGTLPFAAGTSAALEFIWNRDFTATPYICSYSVTALADCTDIVCQVRTDNDSLTESVPAEIPNLRINSVTPVCSSDSNYTVTVVIENTGCSDISSDFNVQLSDDRGYTKNLSVTGLKAGETFSLQYTEWPAYCDPAEVTFTVRADTGSTVCEPEGSDNILIFDYVNESPDILINTFDVSTSVDSAGRISGEFEIEISNNGNTAVTDDFIIRIDDGRGWSREFWYRGDLNGTLPLEPGHSSQLSAVWSRNFNIQPYICNYNNIRLEVDMGGGLCECNSGNNEAFTTFSMNYPALDVDAVKTLCESDGFISLDIDVVNRGCSAVNRDFRIKIKDNRGNSREGTFSSFGGTLPLRAGRGSHIVVREWPSNGEEGTEFEVSFDSAGAFARFGIDIESVKKYVENDLSDLELVSIVWNCLENGQTGFTVEIRNSGNQRVDNADFDIISDTGEVIYHDSISLDPGRIRRVEFITERIKTGKAVNLRAVIDKDNRICEISSHNNEKNIRVECEDESVDPELIKITSQCPPADEQGGIFSFEIFVENSSDNKFRDFNISVMLPAGFTYVKGSSLFSGSRLNDPVAGDKLTWNIDEIAGRGKGILRFSLIADSDVEPGRYCLDFKTSDSKMINEYTPATCCFTVVKNSAQGCCLDVDIKGKGFYRKPLNSVAYVKPCFDTEQAMDIIKASFALWQDIPESSDSFARFIRERVRNYARSTAEELYLRSGLGIVNKSEKLELTFAGSYPYREKDGREWEKSGHERVINLSQIAKEIDVLSILAKDLRSRELSKTYAELADMRLSFLEGFKEDFPHSWSADKHGKLVKSSDKASVRDMIVLYRSLKESDLKRALLLAASVRMKIRRMFGRSFNPANVTEELLLITSKHSSEDFPVIKSKISDLRSLLKRESGTDILNNISDISLAVNIFSDIDPALTSELLLKLKRDFFIERCGVYAQKKGDYTGRITASDLSGVYNILNFTDSKKREEAAHLIFRMTDDTGIFLNRRTPADFGNFFSMIRNSEEYSKYVPVSVSLRSDKECAEVFNKDIIIKSELTGKDEENQVPSQFTRINAPGFERKNGKIAETAWFMMSLGREYYKSDVRVISEHGRSFINRGKRYAETLLTHGSGYRKDGLCLIPSPVFNTRGAHMSRKGDIYSDLKSIKLFSSDLADYLLALRLYKELNGPKSKDIKEHAVVYSDILRKFKDIGYIPESFSVYKREGALQLFDISDKSVRSVIYAKFLKSYDFDSGIRRFLKKKIKQEDKSVKAGDSAFFWLNREFNRLFESSFHAYSERAVNRPSSLVFELLQGRDIKTVREKLLKIWDQELSFIKNREYKIGRKMKLFSYKPSELMLALVLAEETDRKKFRRVLDVTGYEIFKQWELEYAGQPVILPASDYIILNRERRESPEPGDYLRFDVRVDNTCRDGFFEGTDLPQLFIKADFSENLIYAGDEKPRSLTYSGNFTWEYQNMWKDHFLDFSFYGFIPTDLRNTFTFNSEIYAGGNSNFDFSVTDDRSVSCEDRDKDGMYRVEPLTEIRALVFEDYNMNGLKESGEKSIANVLFKDSRGRFMRSDAEGKIYLIAGEEPDAVQLILSSLKSDYLLFREGTEFFNKYSEKTLLFPVVKVKRVTGIVYEDKNSNGVMDRGEERSGSVIVKAGEYQRISDEKGYFEFRDLPLQLKDKVHVSERQPLCRRIKNKFKIFFTESN